MKITHRYGSGSSIAAAAFSLIILLLASWLPNSFAGSDKTPLPAEERLRLGERMYREGILPSGQPMKVFVTGDTSVPGTAFSCKGCHLRSGLGALEDGVLTPPINAAKLFAPLQAYSSATDRGRPFTPPQIVQQNQRYQVSPRRPVYTDATLAMALRSGIDSAGRTMNHLMPRYLLEDGEMDLLISYLKSLSRELSPGVSDTTLRFATIITDDVTPEEQNAMLVPLENFIRNKNLTNFLDPRAGITSRSTGYRSRVMAESTLASRGVAIRKLSLARWVLKGPPESWRSQLEEYQRREPVFAILGGITKDRWEPIHRFCEENRIPSIFPVTDLPVISQSNWYTLYLSKGYYQEGEGVAMFLNENEELQGKPVVQIVRDTREGEALARGFQETWRDLGQTPPMTVRLSAGETLPAAFSQKLAQEKPAAIILWDGPQAVQTLELLAAGENKPTMVLLSSSFLGKAAFSLNERVRDFTYMAYRYGITRSAQEQRTSMGTKRYNAQANAEATVRIAQQTYILTLIMDMALIDMKGNYYRDNLLDVIGTIMDQNVPLYDHVVFGQGQRYASNGCYIVQLTQSGLSRKSGWLSR